MQKPILIRTASSADVETIAALHSESWRTAYRGVYSDRFLDWEAEAFNLDRWRRRFGERDPESWHTDIAEDGDEALGFACVLADEASEWGPLLDNLHVRPNRRGCGIGRELLINAGSWVAARDPRAQLHLLVYEANGPACQFYDSGGRIVERLEADLPGGGTALQLRYLWERPGGIGR